VQASERASRPVFLQRSSNTVSCALLGVQKWQAWTNLVQSAIDANRADIVAKLTTMMDK